MSHLLYFPKGYNVPFGWAFSGIAILVPMSPINLKIRKQCIEVINISYPIFNEYGERIATHAILTSLSTEQIYDTIVQIKDDGRFIINSDDLERLVKGIESVIADRKKWVIEGLLI